MELLVFIKMAIAHDGNVHDACLKIAIAGNRASLPKKRPGACDITNHNVLKL
ncbi:hypothetical protein H6F77_12130 [Microcoleus sp. FACHB-831]|uniref:hypothetical protein n=1 Tax=Microcoleus sp. FACHB-831 TaxID=2692827 RepID=UPI0016884F25|nr:hypothetical protein [Microcoleus sp. FACHB-831]MBD1921837.1 hypothetical protein [Microcoleus sp. FACHB-831]